MEDLGVTSQAPSEFFKSQHYLDLEDEDEPRVCNMCSMHSVTCMYMYTSTGSMVQILLGILHSADLADWGCN